MLSGSTAHTTDSFCMLMYVFLPESETEMKTEEKANKKESNR